MGTISPLITPTKGGVADYVVWETQELVKQGVEVSLVVCNPDHIQIDNVEILTIDRPLKNYLNQVLNFFKRREVEIISLQFTPLAFAPQFYGIAFYLYNWIKQIKKELQVPVILRVHEATYPLEFNLKGILLGIPHNIQFFQFCRKVDAVFFSHQQLINIWKRRLPRRQDIFHCLPVSSNIELISPGAKSNKTVPKILLVFGGRHPTNLYNFVMSAYQTAKEKYAKLELVLIGDVAVERVSSISAGAMQHVNLLGYLPEVEISQWMQEADMLLAPFEDGVSTRRGTVMAALQHGVPILTTRGRMTTRVDVPWEKICLISPSDSLQEYVANLLWALDNFEETVKVGKLGQDYFEQYFARKVVVRKMVEIIVQMKNGSDEWS